jgi:predicted deacylase
MGMTNRVNVDQLLTDIKSAAKSAHFVVRTYGEAWGYPLLVCTRGADQAVEQAKQVYLSTGIHGDEPTPPQALLQLLQADSLPRNHHYTICPCMNPAGLAAGTRENPTGIDLNRDYTEFRSTEIRSHRDWIEANISHLDLALHLHEDWEAAGFYLYELNFNGHESKAAKILAAAAAHLPIETASRIDGHRARRGVIRPKHVPGLSDLPEGLPEAIYLQRRYPLLNYTLETPSALPMEQRIAALRAATAAVLSASK